MVQRPRYDSEQTYAFNYEHPPHPVDIEVPEFPGEWTFCGRRVGSPLGVPAGRVLSMADALDQAQYRQRGQLAAYALADGRQVEVVRTGVKIDGAAPAVAGDVGPLGLPVAPAGEVTGQSSLF